MALRPARPRAMPSMGVCNFCGVTLSKPGLNRQPFSLLYRSYQSKQSSPNRSKPDSLRSISSQRPSAHVRRNASSTAVQDSATPSNTIAAYQRAEQLGQLILKSEAIPLEEHIVEALAACERAAVNVLGCESPSSTNNDPSATIALLSLVSRRGTPSVPSDAVERLSRLSYEIVAHPPVFLSPSVLESFVRIQCLLARPETFPEVFTMYAHKPVPKPGSEPALYSNPNANSISQAVPYAIAMEALDAAIVTKDLDLALAIINSTFRTEAYRNHRLFRKASVPLAGALLAPAAAWIVASRLSTFQDLLDGPAATSAAFAGILTYLGATSTLGYISLTTHNDQMERVVWRPGMGLTERWVREDERAAIDQVALAWGFKDSYKRGLEEGEEWESLRTWIAERGMILDKTELMEGME